MMVSKLLRLLPAAALALGLGSASAADLTGQPLPDISLPALKSGAPNTSRSNLLGKVVYVDFWASWCAPCRASFPWLESMNAKYKDKGLLILGVNKDQEVADAERFLAKYPVSFSLVRDPNDALVNRLGLIGMPTAYLIDRKGVIRTVHKGFRSDDQAELEKAFVALLEQQP
jgi:thiol-disulfide isomerase/thioredoxin